MADASNDRPATEVCESCKLGNHRRCTSQGWGGCRCRYCYAYADRPDSDRVPDDLGAPVPQNSLTAGEAAAERDRIERIVREYLSGVWGRRRMTHVCDYATEIAEDLAQRIVNG